MYRNHVYIYWSKVEHPYAPEALEDSFLTARLHYRHRPYRTTLQQNVSMLGKLLLAYGLDDLRLRHPDELLNVQYHPNGKPYIVKPPVPFSLSHSDRLVACAISLRAVVGIDVQQAVPMRAGSEQVFLNEAERALFPEKPYLELWCQKEAAYKAVSHLGSLRMTEFRFVAPGRLVNGDWVIETYRQTLESGFLCYVALPGGVPWTGDINFVSAETLVNAFTSHGEALCV